MTVNVLLFASVGEAAGTGKVSMTLEPGATAAEVVARVKDAHSDVAGLIDACAVAVNQAFVQKTYALKDGDEVAIIPPVSGG